MKDHPLKQRFQSLIPADAEPEDVDLFYECIQEIESRYESKKDWLSNEMPFEVCKSATDDTIQTINLADTIGQVRAFTDRHERENDQHVYFLPSQFNSNTKHSRAQDILPLFSQACQQSGFRLITKGWEWDQQCIVFACSRCKHNNLIRHLSKQKKKIPHQSEKPTADDPSCPFSFRVYWSSLHLRWFLPHKQAGNIQHLGHHRRDPDQIRMWSNSLDKPTKDLIAVAVKMRLRPPTIARFIYEQCKIELEPYQLGYLYKKLDFQDLVINRAICFDTSPSQAMKDMSPVDWLLRSIEARTDYSYVSIFAHYDTDELRITLRERQKDGSLEEQTVNERDILPQEFDNPDASEDADSIEKYTDSIRKALTVGGSHMILLGIAWTCDDASRQFQMFPECMSVDITFKTNKEKRPHGSVCG